MYIELLIAGFGGGLVRGMVGYLKHQYAYKDVKFDILYFFTMIFLSGTVGVLTSYAVNQGGFGIEGVTYISPAIAFVIGYAGGDFLDNVYKVLRKK